MKQYSALVPIAQKLRHNQTDAEKIIWSKLRDSQTGWKFRRQFPIDPYIVDFACFEKKLVIELDGGQHAEEKDKERTNFIEQRGYKILRFWNHDVLKSTDDVLSVIHNALTQPSPDGRGLEDYDAR